ncbi:hypothetical protein ABEF95_015340 [Exophiala dermatitidis]|uniref:N-acetyltransferase domain-containing protein n=1 Tax=Exophiala dermatitidis TaxID=5970 RepID=A0AAN6IY01_EXODE|nr:hypothetical protein HRR77_006924 [Exophiala dermatitidis]KAJ4561732.1 hypothetical protein HRR79_007068 [Exophiala dermatitidis]KAJ4572537.1 hypothetical protein HRR82_006945 [Exophiala dermatitidis]KAJ4613670.1 hypothetical protein HRR85_003966 [Exophiala dermatitidis]KAJ8994213.1 hypothetical protein HRR80_002708 [Exophiala dermatitidis]
MDQSPIGCQPSSPGTSSLSGKWSSHGCDISMPRGNSKSEAQESSSAAGMMVFDPKAYGDPTAKSKSNTPSKGRQPAIQPVDTEVPSTNHVNETTNPVPSETPVTSQDPVISQAKTLQTSSTDGDRSAGAAMPAAFTPPVFNPYAYGHPGAIRSVQGWVPGKKSALSQSPAQPSINPVNEIKTLSDTRNNVTEALAVNEDLPADKSNHHVAAPKNDSSASSENKLKVITGQEAQGTAIKTTEKLPNGLPYKPRQVVLKEKMEAADHASSASQPGTARANGGASGRKGTKEEKPKPPPATYETLKLAGETPEQVIARLQKAGTREIGLRIRRKADANNTTTALAMLDYLRKPLPSAEDQQDEPLPLELDPMAAALPVKQGRLLKQVGTLSTTPEKASQHQDGRRVSGQASHQISADDGWGTPNVAGNHTAAPVTPPNAKTRWATSKELKAPITKPDSNGEGSEEEESEGDSTRPMGFGRLIRSTKPEVAEYDLRGWDGNFHPPPLDWEDRPRFYNNNAEYIEHFDNWLGQTAIFTLQQLSAARQKATPQESPDLDIAILPTESVCNLNNHSDGIGFVPRDYVLNPYDKSHFPKRLPGEALIDLTIPADFQARTQLDLQDNQNQEARVETAQMFIDKRMAYLERSNKRAEEERLQAIQQQEEEAAEAEQAKQAEAVADGPVPEPEPEPSDPVKPITPLKANIYLRPAVASDFPGMTKIYNWHITNGIRPPELREITTQDMAGRHELCTSNRLPVIVAVERTRKNARKKPLRRRMNNSNQPVQNVAVKDENVVGWAAATDWGAPDYVETITAELEIYVAAEFRQQGIGRCLMDAILYATDRGYNPQRGYDFQVAPEIQHVYTGGGYRDLHKIIFQVRSYNKPVSPEEEYRHNRNIMLSARRGWEWENRNGREEWEESKLPAVPPPPNPEDFCKEAKLNDREDDYSVWLKEWLESYGFEEEALLKKIGTRNRRYVDVRYLTRETCFDPLDGKIQDFSRGF